MTLKEWEDAAGVSPSVHAPSGCVYVVAGYDLGDLRRALFGLWLVPRR